MRKSPAVRRARVGLAAAYNADVNGYSLAEGMPTPFVAAMTPAQELLVPVV